MLATLALTLACAAWHPQATGFYPGVAESDGLKPIDTWIEETQDGRLRGHYIIHEPGRDVSGTLDPVGDDGCNVAVFRWSDVYGEGLARLVFTPERHCFAGAWGHAVVNPALIWHACVRERVTS
jgi:hypothetical protein